MPIMNRPGESDGNYGSNRRMLRTITADLRRSPRNGNGNGGSNARQKQPPPEVTFAENFYYIKQMHSRTPIVVVMTDGEQINGCLEWYDRDCIKVNREGAPNLVIRKDSIKYVFKQDEL
jgi:sRNA-binding regulator protein Hfq